MDSETPNCDGRSSHRSTYSAFHIQSASFLGTGGELGSTVMASFDWDFSVGVTMKARAELSERMLSFVKLVYGSLLC